MKNKWNLLLAWSYFWATVKLSIGLISSFDINRTFKESIYPSSWGVANDGLTLVAAVKIAAVIKPFPIFDMSLNNLAAGVDAFIFQALELYKYRLNNKIDK